MALNVNIIGKDSEGNLRALKVNSEGNLEISDSLGWGELLQDISDKLELVESELQTIKANQLSGDQKVQLSGTLTELEQVRALLDAISGKDFATQTTLAAVLAKLGQLETEIQAVKANQLSGDQKVKLSGTIAQHFTPALTLQPGTIYTWDLLPIRHRNMQIMFWTRWASMREQFFNRLVHFEINTYGDAGLTDGCKVISSLELNVDDFEAYGTHLAPTVKSKDILLAGDYLKVSLHVSEENTEPVNTGGISFVFF